LGLPLADYAVGLRYEDLPTDVVRTAKRTILDTIGCAIGGYQAGPSQIAIKLAGEVSATPGATVFCSGIKTSRERAVFANGVMIRYLDFNDGYITPMRAKSRDLGRNDQSVARISSLPHAAQRDHSLETTAGLCGGDARTRLQRPGKLEMMFKENPAKALVDRL
jgi:hypothetical protein